MFCHIAHIDDVKPHISSDFTLAKTEKFTFVSYRQAKTETFPMVYYDNSSEEVSAKMKLEFRGLVFDNRTGALLSVCAHFCSDNF